MQHSATFLMEYYFLNQNNLKIILKNSENSGFRGKKERERRGSIILQDNANGWGEKWNRSHPSFDGILQII